MTRLPSTPGAPIRKAQPDVYTVLLLVAVIFLIAAIAVVASDLIKNYGMSFVQLFQVAPHPPR